VRGVGYPVVLDVTDRLIVIVGGGAVAARKAAGLAAAGATRIRVIAPQLAAEMPPNIEHVRQNYTASHLAGAALVFAATDRADVNAAVVRDARAAGLFVNRADQDDDEPGDFTMPAVLRRGSVTVAVSCNGAPALAVSVRDQVDQTLDDRWAKLAAATQSLRPRIIASIADIERRRAALRDLASTDAADLSIRSETALKDWLAARYPELR
jgi:siroheme synthase-like protein